MSRSYGERTPREKLKKGGEKGEKEALYKVRRCPGPTGREPRERKGLFKGEKGEKKALYKVRRCKRSLVRGENPGREKGCSKEKKEKKEALYKVRRCPGPTGREPRERSLSLLKRVQRTKRKVLCTEFVDQRSYGDLNPDRKIQSLEC